MSEKNYGNDSQIAEIVKYISDTMKLPLIGAGGGFAPIGTINFFDASVAPQGWLACDGGIYNISDYPELATFYASVHGLSNFYGGNGTTTFAVPDLRGEFIRGAGTNSHANQGNGGAVGEHQDGTEIPDVFISSQNNSLLGGSSATNYDNRITDGRRYTVTNGTYSSTDNQKRFTSRPTNTSFLICVKATVSDAEINAFNVYTPREHQVAWWEEKIDGVWKRKPVYERTITGTTADTFALTDLDAIRSIDGTYTFGSQGGGTKGATRGFAGTDSTSGLYGVLSTVSDSGVLSFVVRGLTGTISIRATLQYTKTTDDWQTS